MIFEPASFTKRKFLQLDLSQQHKKCAELLRHCYNLLLQNEPCNFEVYQQWLSWMKQLPFASADPKSIADRYHWHLTHAGQSLKEHNLLPRIRKGDRAARSDYLPIAIYLDNVRSAYNVGSILRTCEALRLGHVYFSHHTPDHEHEKVIRTAMGAAALVPCSRNVLLGNLPRPIIALDTSDEAISLNEFIFPSSFTIVLGNEEYGISDDVLRAADFLVEIPLMGSKNSLNVACAFAIAGAQIRRKISENPLRQLPI
jgi:tRNA G18 (ribose-2'-O)-methylase SpoU